VPRVVCAEELHRLEDRAHAAESVGMVKSSAT
jgi:hypothetical protein